MTAETTRTARIEVLAQLKDLQIRWKQEWLDRSIPDDWDFIEERYPVTRKKTKLTVTLDEDMVRWFRKLGRGYQARINGILRVYWQGLQSGSFCILSHAGWFVVLAWKKCLLCAPRGEYFGER